MLALTALVFLATLAQEPAPTYQAITMRAAPGGLVELIDLLNGRMPVYQAAGEPRPVLMRHSQGDHWDLLLLVPIGSMEEHFSRNRAGRWRDALRRTGYDDDAYASGLDRLVAWSEELYVTGPPVAELQSRVAAAGFFHLEVFQALAGKRDSLLQQRRMENDFLARIGRPGNLIFTKVTGAPWDQFTLGFYRDLQHYAEPSRLSPEAENSAAVAAGFQSRSHIGPYLRQFLSSHHDTIGSIVR